MNFEIILPNVYYEENKAINILNSKIILDYTHTHT